jgi:hypothetical protein
MALVSIPKNIVLVLLSVAIWSTQISGIQIIGYSISLLALLYHAVGWEAINAQWEKLRGLWREPKSPEKEDSLLGNATRENV